MIYQAEEPDPVIVEIHSGFSSNLQNMMLANSITLTPGTITLFQEGDHLVIHCLRREYAEGLTDSSFARILRHLK
jgi:multicomponent Na+:H+ antiporter subunit E